MRGDEVDRLETYDDGRNKNSVSSRLHHSIISSTERSRISEENCYFERFG